MTQERQENPPFPAGAALVVGGSGGLGDAICRTLASQGSDVALTYHGNKEAADTVAQAVTDADRKSASLHLPLDHAEAVAEIVDGVAADFGAIHTLIFTIGPDIGQPFVSQVTPEEWRKVMEVEPVGYFNVLHATLPHLRTSQGSVVAVTSAATLRYAPRDILSAGPKASVNLLTQAIAREEGRHGVRANIVAPGFITAGLGQHLLDTIISERELEGILRSAALRRMGTAEEVAEVVAFLASSKASLVTGQTIAADGGYSA